MGHSKGKLMKRTLQCSLTLHARESATKVSRRYACHSSTGSRLFANPLMLTLDQISFFALKQHKKCLAACILVLIHTPINKDVHYVHSRTNSLVFIVKLLFLELNQALQIIHIPLNINRRG